MSELSFSDLLGKTILVGITYYTKDNEFIEQKQYWGTVIEANDRQIRFRQKNGVDILPLARVWWSSNPGEAKKRLHSFA